MLPVRSLFRLVPSLRYLNNRQVLNCQPLNLVPQTRQYAKSKDRKKDSKMPKKVLVELNEEQMSSVINVEQLNAHMQKAITIMKDEFVKNLSLRSTTGAIETLKIGVDGNDYELQELGQIVRKNPKTIIINMVAFPQTIPQVLQTLSKSGMNLNPQQDGTTIFIPVPKVTKEHRENLAKNAKTLFIKCRDAIKDIQNQHIKKVKKQTEISSDLNHQVQNQVVAVAENYIKEAEKLMVNKQGELLGGKDEK